MPIEIARPNLQSLAAEWQLPAPKGKNVRLCAPSLKEADADELLSHLFPFLEMAELWKDVVEKGQSNEGPPMGERV